MSVTRPRRLIAVALLSAVLFAATSCLGQDFVDTPLSLNELDHGWLATIEPGEEFDIGLRGNAAFPAVGWEVVEYDASVIQLSGRELAPLAEPAVADVPIPPVSVFFFEGVGPGETPLVFEFVVDGERIDIARYTVAVVDDACDADLGATANRCGRAFTYHPQHLTELDLGQSVALEPGTAIELTLTANALHPELPWEVRGFDADVIAIDGPRYVPPDRQPGEWGPWEPDSRHSFLPASTFTITGSSVGMSELVLELPVDGSPIDRYVLAVEVVDDA